MQLERAADDVCLAFLLERRLADADPAEPPVFQGEVVGLVEKGAFVRFGKEGFEGLLPARRLHDWWTLNELGTALVAESSGRELRLGATIDVVVDRVEVARGRVDLAPPGAYS
jgi:ribonuclease R